MDNHDLKELLIYKKQHYQIILQSWSRQPLFFDPIIINII